MAGRLKEFAKKLESENHFIPREFYPRLGVLVVLYYVSFAVLTQFAAYKDFFVIGGELGFWIFAIALVSALTFFTVYITQTQRDAITASEFQNLLFTSSATVGSKFSIIMQEDGSIIYQDTGFRRSFPSLAKSTILGVNEFLRAAGIPENEKARIYDAIKANVRVTIFTNITLEGGKKTKMVINIDPLSRPSGFFLVRARDYINRDEKPTTKQESMNDVIIYRMFDELSLGVYMATTDGKLTYTNRAFEEILGAKKGELLGKNILDLAFVSKTKKNNLSIKQDFDGKTKLKNSGGKNIDVLVNQIIFKDAKKASIGIGAIVTK